MEMLKNSKIISGLILILIVALTMAIYWQGLSGPFLLDDSSNIDAAYLNRFNWDEIIYGLSHNSSGALGRPVSIFSFIISGLMHGPSPWGYKFHNLLIHLINGLVIFWLLIKLIPHLDEKLNSNKTLLLAGAAASCWMLHPLLVSTVLYAVQRMTELSSLFTLLALLVYVICRENVSRASRFTYLGFYFFFPLFMMLAMFSKENGALTPFYVFAIEMIVFQFKFVNVTEKKKVYCFLTIFVFLPVILGSIYVLTHFGRLTSYSIRNFDLYERLLTETHAIAFYIKLTLIPRLSDMSLFHDDFPVIRNFDLLTCIYTLAIFVSLILIFVLRRKARFISFGLAWFLISHLMESTFFDLELVFEHRNYMAVLGLLLPTIYYLLRPSKYKWTDYVFYCYFFVLVFLTILRVQEWKSEELIYLVALEDHPKSVRVHSDYANFSYYSGEYERAFEHLHIVQELQPKEAAPVIHEILMLCVLDLPLESKTNEAKMRLEESPVTPYTLNALDMLILAKNDKEFCSNVEIKDMIEMVQIASMQKKNGYSAMLQRLEGILYFMLGEYPKGEAFLRLSYDSNGRVATLFDLADVQLRYGLIDDLMLTIAELESINTASFRTEATKLAALKLRFEQISLDMESAPKK